MTGEPREVVLIDISKITFTSKIRERNVKYLAEHLEIKKFDPVCAYHDGDRYILTDGNHRTKALERIGQQYVPAILLTKKEFDFVAFSKNNHIDVMAKIPEKIKICR